MGAHPGRHSALTARACASVLAAMMVASACQAAPDTVPPASSPRNSAPPVVALDGFPLIAYTVPREPQWWRPGTVGFTVTNGTSPLVTWAKHVEAGMFAAMGAPGFTADGRYAFVQHRDETAGRFPYDGTEIRAELVWIDVADRQAHTTPIPARSRSDTEKPARPGAPFALEGSTVVWQGIAAPDGGPDVPLMTVDLSQPDQSPQRLRTVELPPRDDGQEPTGTVVGAGGGRVAIAAKYGADRSTRADRLFLVDVDGSVIDLGPQPTTYWASAVFSPDATRFAYETGLIDPAGGCRVHQVTVFDSATGAAADDFPPGPVGATPQPYFVGNVDSAVWWTPQGRLRANGSGDGCPTDRSETTSVGGVWEFDGSTWTPVDPDGTYRDFPLPDGDAAVVVDVPRDVSPTGARLELRSGQRQIPIAEVEVAGVAVPPR